MVPNSLSELEMLPSHPLPPLHRSLESLCLTQISCCSVHQWWVSTYTAESSAWLGPPTWGRTGTTVCAQLITQIFTSTAVSVPGLTTTLEHGFPLVGTGKYLLFYSPSVPGRACASANPHCTWCAPATQCHKQHPPQPRESVTSVPAPLATVHTQCSANTVPCATHLLQPRTYSRGQKQH